MLHLAAGLHLHVTKWMQIASPNTCTWVTDTRCLSLHVTSHSQGLLHQCCSPGVPSLYLTAVIWLACRNRGQAGDHKIPADVLQSVEQTDLIRYGLIPEFVGRFPVLCSLQVCLPMLHKHPCTLHGMQMSLASVHHSHLPVNAIYLLHCTGSKHCAAHSLDMRGLQSLLRLGLAQQQREMHVPMLAMSQQLEPCVCRPFPEPRTPTPL